MDDLQQEILTLLQARELAGDIRLATLTDLAAATQQPDTAIRRVCGELEAARWIRGLHARTGDLNPRYEITLSGMLVLDPDE